MKVTLAKLAFALLAAAASVEGEEVKKKSPVLRGAVQVAVEASESVSASADEYASSDKTPASSDSEELFPDDVEEEISYDDDSHGKPNSAQKRQAQRDARRAHDNPNRSQHEEQRERERKNNQSRRSGNACRDPNEPGCGNDSHPANRENNRINRCNTYGTSCNHHRVSPYDEPNQNRSNRDSDCIYYCYGDPNCISHCSAVAQG
mmetsp:Transcript_18411/g.38664  ORF Transcript_18411/g.38664 Transcript_18411/m.38664 type:complete len:205 (+) Transcript_18411:280-894(+)|eukprot:CAMPEP_0183707688 /NCGR_PEP_ID=MMETSP0737-20130205/4196_1 /TAXON_ID=385413 /ORGANISM="Thalassiosira miniscula, Strain CCMP1093" /LENGTH=204 /DNA_ID=CAMNT_0025935415 /DNA_START=171 /DNA_END=785 /DNA_ORIENTATION=-